jgi:hypothetical protein
MMPFVGMIMNLTAYMRRISAIIDTMKAIIDGLMTILDGIVALRNYLGSNNGDEPSGFGG